MNRHRLVFRTLLLVCALGLTPRAWGQVEIPPGVDARQFLQNYRTAQENAQNPTYSSFSELGPGAFQCDSSVTLDGNLNFVTADRSGEVSYRLPEALYGSLVLIQCRGEVRRGSASASLTDAAKVPQRNVVLDSGPGEFSGRSVLGLGKQVLYVTVHLAPNTCLKLSRVNLAKRVR